MSVKPIPEGYTSLTPFLCIDGASAAIDFYVSVFGAELVDRMDGPGGTVAMPSWISATAACSCRTLRMPTSSPRLNPARR